MDNLMHLSKGIGGKVSPNKGIGGNKNDKTDGNGCLIETLAIEMPSAINIDLLREFRDHVLRESAIGKMIIRTYYRLSPVLIKLTTRYTFLKIPSKWVIILGVHVARRQLS